jgi:hypothetical protein
MEFIPLWLSVSWLIDIQIWRERDSGPINFSVPRSVDIDRRPTINVWFWMSIHSLPIVGLGQRFNSFSYANERKSIAKYGALKVRNCGTFSGQVPTIVTPIDSPWRALQLYFWSRWDWTKRSSANSRKLSAPSCGSGSFWYFAAERFTWLSWSQKTFDRTFSGLSIGIHLNEIRF